MDRVVTKGERVNKAFRFRNGWHGWYNPHDEPGEIGGRFSVYLCDEEHPRVDRRNLHGEWNLMPSYRAIGFGFSMDDEDTSLGLHAWLASLYLSTGRWRRRVAYPNHRRQFEVAVSRGLGFKALLWTDDHDSSSPRQYVLSWFRLKNALLGRQRRAERLRGVYDVMVRIPGDETEYPVTVRLETWTITRPRWPFPRVVHHADVDVLDERGIPYEGDGENAWDVGTDATFAMSCQARTVGEAVGRLVGSIVDRRVRHGWTPSATRWMEETR